jgi:soluble lytic murein transglycosylase
MEQQRQLFLRLEQELKQKKLQNWQSQKKLLKQYPLYPYLEYQLLSNNLSQINKHDISRFQQKYTDCPLAEKLNQQWLRQQAKNQQWQSFLDGYYDTDNTELQCHYLEAHHRTYHDAGILRYVEGIWLTGASLPNSCNYIVRVWEETGHMNKNLLWQRVKLAIEQNNRPLAQTLSKKLDAEGAKLIELWLRIDKQPELISHKIFFQSRHPAIKDILVYALKKMAQKNPALTIKLWQGLTSSHNFSRQHWFTVIKAIGLSLAADKHPDADTWLAQIPSDLVDHAILEARLRIALTYKNWQKILELHNIVPESFEHEEKLLYWYAKALEKTFNVEAGKQILKQLAQKRSYYGFLAAKNLQLPFAIHDHAMSIHESELQHVHQKAGILRAYEWQKLNRMAMGKAEWLFALKHLNDQEKEIAAMLAAQWKQPNWAILALSHAKSKDNLSIRFPRSYSGTVFREAALNNLNPAFIFAITRQESAFVVNARSPAGALGLMQVMPATGMMMAKKERLYLRHPSELLNAEVNLQFGSKYLRYVMDKYQQNPVLAAAAYNAGPNRVLQWLPSQPLPADHWIELIPYRETRHYVQNILTYTVIYQRLLGQSTELHSYMPMVQARPLFGYRD